MAEPDERNIEKDRKCLRCDKMFLSRDAGNRICKKCTSANADERSPKPIPPFYFEHGSWFDHEDL
jgi:hypothetical protein